LPAGLHGQFGTAAAIAGKHVVVEKPIDTTLEAARRMINACHEQRTTLSVIFPYRFTPSVAQVKAALDQGMLGRLIAAEATIKWYREPAYYESSPWKGRKRLDGGGALINQSIHYIDLLLWMMGDVKKVTSLVRTAVHKIEVEDLAMALVEFESGAIGSVTGATALKPGFPERLEIYGERGAIAIEAGRIVRWKVDGQAEADFLNASAENCASADPAAISFENHRRQFQAIALAIRTGKPVPVSGEDGLRSLELVLNLYQANERWLTGLADPV
jgi:UDP-N-acetyl-2-amino-2-deoxyglucuronate dehydrogenase